VQSSSENEVIMLDEESEICAHLSEIQSELGIISDTLSKVLELLLPDRVPEELGLEGVQAEVYSLCDGKTSVKEMSDKIDKSGSHIRKSLTRLRRKGLLRRVGSGKDVLYFKTPILLANQIARDNLIDKTQDVSENSD
jgi:DNA-binding transcriptional ArsR family regulator